MPLEITDIVMVFAFVDRVEGAPVIGLGVEECYAAGMVGHVGNGLGGGGISGRLPLAGDGFHASADFIRISQEIVFLQVQRVVKFEYVRNGCGQVQGKELFVGNMLQVLDDAAQRIAVGYDEDVVPCFQGSQNGPFPICLLYTSRCV